MPISIDDFCPLNKWKIDEEGPRFEGENEFAHVIDQTTKKAYLNESPSIVGFKCFLLTLGTPFVHTAACICKIALNIFNIAQTLMSDEKKGFFSRLFTIGKHVLNIALAPIALVGLELAAIYGIFNPYDGRKLYASMERATYGHFVLAPCFQPEARRHLFGGDINQKNAF
jgi:hypothetical protein